MRLRSCPRNLRDAFGEGPVTLFAGRVDAANCVQQSPPPFCLFLTFLYPLSSVTTKRQVGATRGFDSLGTAIADNPGCRLTTLTLANNMIKDKAALKLARGLATLEIEFLDLSGPWGGGGMG